MMGIITELLTVARKLNNYEIDPVTGLKVLWVDTTHYRVTVPAGRRWFVFGGMVNRNVSSTMTINAYDVGDDIIIPLQYLGAGTGQSLWPNTDASTAAMQFAGLLVLDAGDYIEVLFGTAQDAGSYATCLVLEVSI